MTIPATAALLHGHAVGQAGGVGAPGPGVPAAAELAGAERQLLDLARRGPSQGWVAIVLHLSRLDPPAPRPHHRRVARAVMQDSALRHEGQVFALRNGDIVLLCRSSVLSAGGGGSKAASQPLPATLARLLLLDAPVAGDIVSTWTMPEGRQSLLSYASDRLADGLMDPPNEFDLVVPTGSVDVLASLFETGEAEQVAQGNLLHRQTAVMLAPRSGAAGRSLLPIFREVSFSLAALEARAGSGVANADPFLFRHLAGRLDRRMIEILGGALGQGGPLDATARPGLHVNLSPPGILSDAFARVASSCRSAGATIGVELDLLEAGADPEAYRRARIALADAGATLVLDGVTHVSLALTCPEILGPDLLKLTWSPRMAMLGPAERSSLQDSLARIGLGRVILQRADSEKALQWGLAQGITRFQGRHVDAMLGVSRLLACPGQAGCALRQCVERESATAPGGRAGCTNLALLDAGISQRDGRLAMREAGR